MATTGIVGLRVQVAGIWTRSSQRFKGSADISGEPWTRTVTSSTSSSSRGGIGERPCAFFARC